VKARKGNKKSSGKTAGRVKNIKNIKKEEWVECVKSIIDKFLK